MDLIKSKEIEVKDVDGELHQFIIGRLPAIEGRKILSLYPIANAPKIGDYEKSEEGMLLLMKHVERVTPNGNIRLQTKALIDNHIPDAECLIRLEMEALKYNVSFFKNAGGLGFVGLIQKIISGSVPQIIQTLMSSLGASSPKGTQASQSLKEK